MYNKFLCDSTVFKLKTMPYIDAEKGSHPMQVVRVIGHSQYFGYNGILGPLCSEFLHQLHQVTCGRLSDGIYCGLQKPTNKHT